VHCKNESIADNSKQTKTISVITATYNAEKSINQLIQSLQNQSDKDFEWIVADGGSNDGTLSLIKDASDLNVNLDSARDCGIYDALNRAVSLCTSDYYIVLGADDLLYQNSIFLFKEEIKKSPGASFYCFALNEGGFRIKKPKKGKFWLYGLGGECSGHAVSLVIRRSVHQRIGLYSTKYTICADQYLVGKAVKEELVFKRSDICVGEYGIEGFSAQNRLASLCESFLIKHELCEFKILQVLLFILRLIKFSVGRSND